MEYELPVVLCLRSVPNVAAVIPTWSLGVMSLSLDEHDAVSNISVADNIIVMDLNLYKRIANLDLFL